MLVNRTIAVVSLVGGTAQTVNFPRFTDGTGADENILRNRKGQLKSTNTTAVTYLKFLLSPSDPVASASNYDIAVPIVSSSVLDATKFAIPANAVGISLFNSAATVSQVLSVGN